MAIRAWRTALCRQSTVLENGSPPGIPTPSNGSITGIPAVSGMCRESASCRLLFSLSAAPSPLVADRTSRGGRHEQRSDLSGRVAVRAVLLRRSRRRADRPRADRPLADRTARRPRPRRRDAAPAAAPSGRLPLPARSRAAAGPAAALVLRPGARSGAGRGPRHRTRPGPRGPAGAGPASGALGCRRERREPRLARRRSGDPQPTGAPARAHPAAGPLGRRSRRRVPGLVVPLPPRSGPHHLARPPAPRDLALRRPRRPARDAQHAHGRPCDAGFVSRRAAAGDRFYGDWVFTT